MKYILLSVFAMALFSNSTKAQDSTFKELFKTAYECSDCADTTQIRLYNMAIDLGITDSIDLSNFRNALANRGILLMENEEFNKAISDFNLALSIDSTSYDVLQNLGSAYLQSGQYTDALRKYDEYIYLLESEKEESLKSYAIDSTEVKNEETILQNDEMRAIEEREWNSKLARAFNNRGITKAHLRNHVGACVDFKRAYDLGMSSLRHFIDQECK